MLGIAADGMDAGETLTGEDGSFRIAPLRPGRYTVFSGLGTSLVTRLGARGVSVEPGAMSRLDVLEPRSGSAVHVSVLGADGRPIDAQALLVAGPPRESGSFDSVLASDAVYLPDPGEVRIVLPRVPPGTYTLILLRNVEQPPVAARDPVRVSGADMHLTVRLGAGLPGP